MSRQFNMPVDRDVNSNQTSSRSSSSGLFTMYPTDDGKVFHNKVYFTLFRPAAWKLFQDNKIGNSIAVPEDLYSFYFRLFGHYVKTEDDEGNMHTDFALCHKRINNYLIESLGYKALFADDRCRSCEEADKWWGEWKNKWAELGYPDKKRYELAKNKDEYKDFVEKKHPELKQVRDEAFKYSPQERYVFNPLDYSKMLGEKPMNEGEAEVLFQIYLGSKTIFSGLHNIMTMGIKFWDIENPRTIVITRNTSKGVRHCEYQITLFPENPDFNEAEKEYIADEKNLPDPTPFLANYDYETLARMMDLSTGTSRVLGSGNGSGNGAKKPSEEPALKIEEPVAQNPSIDSKPVDQQVVNPPSRRRMGVEPAQSVENKPVEQPVMAHQPSQTVTQSAMPHPDVISQQNPPLRRRRGSQVW